MCLPCFSFVCRMSSDAPHDRLVCELNINEMVDMLLIHKRLLLIIPLGECEVCTHLSALYISTRSRRLAGI